MHAPPAAMSLRREAQAGLQAGMVASVQALTHGIIAFGAIGAAGVAYGMSAALAVSGATALAMASIARSRPLVGTTTAASAIILASVIAGAGPTTLAQAVAIALALAATAGALVLLLAATGFARFTAMMPASVTQGLKNATAAIITLNMLPLMFGGGAGAGWQAMVPGAVAVGGVALVLVLRPPRGVPAPLAALAAATVLHHMLNAAGIAVGPEVDKVLAPAALAGEIQSGWHSLLAAPPSPSRILPGAATIALLVTIETLSASAALREASGRRTDYGRDLFAAGTGLLAGAGLGGVPASALTVPTITAWLAGGRTRATQFCGAAVPFAVLLLGAPLLSELPLAGLAGVLVGAVLRLVQLPLAPIVEGAGRSRRWSDAAISCAVLGAALLSGLLAAVGVGVLVAAIVFTGSMARSPIRRAYRNPIGRSKLRRPIETELWLRKAGDAIALLELEGPIFFGSADHALQRIEAEFAAGAVAVVLDMSRITHIDMSGGRRLLEACSLAPGRVLVAPLHRASRAAAEFEDLGLFDSLPPSAICFDLASAVERAESLVLRSGEGQAYDDRPDGAAAALQALGLSPDQAGEILAFAT